jgi:hypothetical protein
MHSVLFTGEKRAHVIANRPRFVGDHTLCGRYVTDDVTAEEVEEPPRVIGLQAEQAANGWCHTCMSVLGKRGIDGEDENKPRGVCDCNQCECPR